MINLFGKASFGLCEKLDAAASDGEDVEMESLFSRLTLDIIGKAVFNYEFDSLTHDNGIVEVIICLFLLPLESVKICFFSIICFSVNGIIRQYMSPCGKQRCVVLLPFLLGKFQYGKTSPQGRGRFQKPLS